MTSPIEFLGLTNLDFTTPGSLTQRWGSTMYVGQTLPGPIHALTEFARLDGSSWVIFGSSGTLYYGATTGQSQGISLSGTTTVFNFFSPFDMNAEASTFAVQFVSQSLPYLGDANELIYGATAFDPGITTAALNIGGPAFILPSPAQSENRLSFSTMNNYLFMADGQKFMRFDGATASSIGAPPPLVTRIGYQKTGTSPGQDPFNGAGNPNHGHDGVTMFGSGSLNTIGSTGSYAFAMSYVDDRGFEGQIWPVAVVNAAQASGFGTTFPSMALWMGAYVPPDYNISKINVYYYWSAATLSMGFTTTWNLPYTFLNSWSLLKSTTLTGLPFNQMTAATYYINPSGATWLGGITLYPISLGAKQISVGTGVSRTSIPWNGVGNLGSLASPSTNNNFPLGWTATRLDTLSNVVQSFSEVGYNPQILETYKERLFMAGFSATPSTVVYSETGEPEAYPLENNFEVRTEDGDNITAMKAFLTQLYVFKKGSFHVLQGDNPNNFFLQEVSQVYGCLNKRSVVIMEQNMLFLDRKGIMQWNGSSISHISVKIQPIFERMNYASALIRACMVHDKLRNQVLIGIPVDGSTANNMTIVYDYVMNAWTTYAGFTPTVFAAIQGRNNSKNAFYGDSVGRVNWMGASFFSDNGVGFTTYFKTRFLKDLGDTTQKQFRRQYINMDPMPAGTTFQFNFYQDYGSSIVLTRGTTQAVFQNRIDYGISAKSLAFEMFNISPTSPLRIHGFAIESRLQRRV